MTPATAATVVMPTPAEMPATAEMPAIAGATASAETPYQ